jgi:hypothetical protein
MFAHQRDLSDDGLAAAATAAGADPTSSWSTSTPEPKLARVQADIDSGDAAGVAVHRRSSSTGSATKAGTTQPSS